jgi:uncharacterized protein YxjI
MAVTVVCTCSKSFELKDEFAGTLVKCPNCGATSRAGTATATATMPAPDPIFGRDVFLLRQKVAIDEVYTVTDEQGEPLLAIERPAHFLRNMAALGAAVGAFFVTTNLFLGIATVLGDSLAGGLVAMLGVLAAPVVAVVVGLALSKKRHVSFFAGADKTGPRIVEILQDHKVRFPTQTYTVRDDQGRRLGILSKNYLYNVFRKQWMIRDWRGKPVCVVKEDSIILSLLRRFLGPAFGLLRTNFVFLQFGNERELGEFKRKLTILDRYVLDLGADQTRALDRKLAVATAVMLDSAERR